MKKIVLAISMETPATPPKPGSLRSTPRSENVNDPTQHDYDPLFLPQSKRLRNARATAETIRGIHFENAGSGS